MGCSETRSPFGSPDAATGPVSWRLPDASRTSIALPFGSGASLNSMRISVGGLIKRASAAGVERT